MCKVYPRKHIFHLVRFISGMSEMAVKKQYNACDPGSPSGTIGWYHLYQWYQWYYHFYHLLQFLNQRYNLR